MQAWETLYFFSTEELLSCGIAIFPNLPSFGWAQDKVEVDDLSWATWHFSSLLYPFLCVLDLPVSDVSSCDCLSTIRWSSIFAVKVIRYFGRSILLNALSQLITRSFLIAKWPINFGYVTKIKFAAPAIWYRICEISSSFLTYNPPFIGWNCHPKPAYYPLSLALQWGQTQHSAYHWLKILMSRDFTGRENAGLTPISGKANTLEARELKWGTPD